MMHVSLHPIQVILSRMMIDIQKRDLDNNSFMTRESSYCFNAS